MENANNSEMQRHVVAARLLIPMEFPADWSDGDIRFYLHNSYCASSLLYVLDEMSDGGKRCICNYCDLQVVDEALKAKIIEEFEFEPPVFAEVEGQNDGTDSVP